MELAQNVFDAAPGRSRVGQNATMWIYSAPHAMERGEANNCSPAPWVNVHEGQAAFLLATRLMLRRFL